MANTSDGGKGDPPDPSHTDKSNDTLSLLSLAVHHDNNYQVSTETDPVSPKYSANRPSVNPPSLANNNQSPTLNDHDPSPTDSPALSNLQHAA